MRLSATAVVSLDPGPLRFQKGLRVNWAVTIGSIFSLDIAKIRVENRCRLIKVNPVDIADLELIVMAKQADMGAG
jgi:hypothetical protein